MAFYLIYRNVAADFELDLARLLEDGRHTLEMGDTSLEFEINKQVLVLDFTTAKGFLEGVWCIVLPEMDRLGYWREPGGYKVDSITIRAAPPLEHDDPELIGIMKGNKQVTLGWYDSPPTK